MSKYDIKYVELKAPSIYIGWGASDIGFGELYFFCDKDTNAIHCYNEGMSKEFIKAVLCKMVDDSVLS